jgi:hypothetical protein
VQAVPAVNGGFQLLGIGRRPLTVVRRTPDDGAMPNRIVWESDGLTEREKQLVGAIENVYSSMAFNREFTKVLLVLVAQVSTGKPIDPDTMLPDTDAAKLLSMRQTVEFLNRHFPDLHARIVPG